MINYCPWGKSAIMVEPKLKEWIKSWMGDQTIFLTSQEWFTRGHDVHSWIKKDNNMWYPQIKPGRYVWSPPPAAADACMEELRKARMKRKLSTHVVVIQRLMTPKWLKQLIKAADCIFPIPASHPYWPSHHCEPLVVAILFPYLNYRPYQLKGTPKMFQMGRSLSQMFQETEVDTRSVLLQFLLGIEEFGTMSECMVWRVLYLGTKPPFPRRITSQRQSGEQSKASGKRKRDQTR